MNELHIFLKKKTFFSPEEAFLCTLPGSEEYFVTWQSNCGAHCTATNNGFLVQSTTNILYTRVAKDWTLQIVTVFCFVYIKSAIKFTVYAQTFQTLRISCTEFSGAGRGAHDASDVKSLPKLLHCNIALCFPLYCACYAICCSVWQKNSPITKDVCIYDAHVLN